MIQKCLLEELRDNTTSCCNWFNALRDFGISDKTEIEVCNGGDKGAVLNEKSDFTGWNELQKGLEEVRL